MSEGVAMHDNLNCTEDLMRVNAKTEDKNAVFEKYRAQYVAHFAKNAEYEASKQAIAQNIVAQG